MNPPGKRSGVMTLKTVGRAFWIGLAASLLLHVFLIAQGHFQMPRWTEPVELQVRIENPLEAIPPQIPERIAAPATPIQPQPASTPQQTPSVPPKPAPEPSTAKSEPAPEPPAQIAVADHIEPTLPLSTAKPTPQSAQPYSALTKAAENIRQLPAHIEIVYELNGLLSGRQTHVWDRSGESYTLQAEGEVTGLAGLFVRGQLVQKSSGRIGPLGLMPEQYEMQRLSGKKEALRFDYDANIIESIRPEGKRGSRNLELPMLPGVQDPLSSIYQLAMVARNNSDGLIVAASAKRVKGYPFQTIGTESVNTGLGTIQALHVTRAGDSEKSATHLWLDPRRQSLPVKVSYVDDDGNEWVLEAVSIKTR